MFTAKNLLRTSGVTDYRIARSVRLRASASANLSRTPSGAGNRQTWTLSFWMKRGSLSASPFQNLFLCQALGSSTNYAYFGIDYSSGYGDGVLVFEDFQSSVSNGLVKTAGKFLDPNAWYHVVFVFDTTNATAANRIRIYINGVLQTLTITTQISQNTNGYINTATATFIGSNNSNPSSNFFDGYLADIIFVGGQALTPTSFGAFDAVTGVWNPIRYTGTYGTNGFYLNFSDNSGATATTIGKDSSGNGNNWTPTNISVTAGTTYDSMVDSPTNYGSDTGVGAEVRGNYATLNPLANGTAAYVKNGNLRINPSDGNFQPSLSTIGVSSGKWYAECTITAVGSGAIVGIDKLPSTLVATNYLGNSSTSYGYYGDGTNARLYNNSSFTSYGATYTTGAVIGVALDMDAGTLVFYRNGVSQGTAATGLSGTYAIGASPAGAAGIADMNYGQRAFSYTAPSGYKALCTQNLPTPTILNGSNYMAATLYTGNGTSQSLVNTVNSISFQPDFVWTKCRSTINNHGQLDSVRGISRWLGSNTTQAEDYTAGSYVTAFNSNGFSVGTGGVSNENGQTYVGWQWKAGGTAVTNTNGTITSSVSASTTAGFSVVTYTGNGTNGASVGHGLGVTPAMVFFKMRSGVQDWIVYHTSLATNQYLFLGQTAAAQTASGWFSADSNKITFSTSYNGTSQNASTYVSYCFAPIAGYSAFGSYTGNGSTDGPFVYLGFRPRWLLIKRSDSTGSWYIWDTSRSPYNQATLALYPNLSDAEPGGDDIDFLSNGFKMRDTFSYINASGGTFLYAAFGENPFKYSRAR